MKKSMRNYDLTKIIGEEHAGKWLALNLNRTKIVGFSENLEDLEKKIGRKKVVYMRASTKGAFSFVTA
ncbi:MAG TPA: hypothetical protein VG753_03245 [Candidatus Paceibacterota bacterium]|nr:hypothetical protein [Candidatus Paceibacterota bacterium]